MPLQFQFNHIPFNYPVCPTQHDDTIPNPQISSNNLSSSNINELPKKRKRVRKIGDDKKFQCSHSGCGKSYSRAEHLHRHQLNRMYFTLSKSCPRPYMLTY